MTRLDTIEARAAAATPGPWRASWCGDDVGICGVDSTGVACTVLCIDNDQDADEPMPFVFCSREDSAFIAHAREDVPWLCARVRELEAWKAEAFAVYEDYASIADDYCEMEVGQSRSSALRDMVEKQAAQPRFCLNPDLRADSSVRARVRVDGGESQNVWWPKRIEINDEPDGSTTIQLWMEET